MGFGEGKRGHLVGWDLMCRLKEFGGLGLGKIALRNQALLGKWLWRYLFGLLSFQLSRAFPLIWFN